MVEPIGSQADWRRLLTVAVGRAQGRPSRQGSRQGKALSGVPTEGVVISPTIPGGRVSSIVGGLLATTLIHLPPLSHTSHFFKASHKLLSFCSVVRILASSESLVIYICHQGCLK